MLIKSGDVVQVVSGDDRGKRGKVLRVFRTRNKLLIEGINRTYKHVKPNKRNPQGGRLLKELPIAASNAMLIDPQSNKPTRVGVRQLADGSKERYAKRSGASLGVISPPTAKKKSMMSSGSGS